MYSPGIAPGRYSDFAEALYVSLVTLATLGYGDVVATAPALRLLSPLQALTGFVLFTASVSWLTQLYPALARRRTLALRTSLLRSSGGLEALIETGNPSVAAVLQELAAQLAQVRVDLGQNAESYYFVESTETTSLPLALEYLQQLSRRAAESSDASIAASGAILERSMQDF
ncbi:potassium channel family protein [Ramlibacter sp. AN1015]|uniref:potassium channel family protein n=1 Tax=Ramlibacter sp. AN1015 TaxID=3133428 RepID=UPI0030C2B7A4